VTFSLNNYLQSFPTIKHQFASVTVIALLSLFSLPVSAAQSLPGKIFGKLIDSRNNTAISQHTIYIADLSMLSDRNSRLTAPRLKSALPSSNNAACDKPKLPYKTYTCTNANGEFTLVVQTATSNPYYLAIVGQQGAVKINATSSQMNIGNIHFTAKMPHSMKIAIISLSAHTSSIRLGHKINTGLSKVVSYLFDSEILSAYGIDISNNDIEYYRNLSNDTDGNSILDVTRFMTVLVKGTWQEILTQHSPETIKLMLKFVEQGGTLLIKDNKTYSSLNSEVNLYI